MDSAHFVGRNEQCFRDKLIRDRNLYSKGSIHEKHVRMAYANTPSYLLISLELGSATIPMQSNDMRTDFHKTSPIWKGHNDLKFDM